MMNEKIEIGYAKKTEVDFGMLSEEHRDGILKVDKEWWHLYVGKRHDFEVIHQQLIRSLPHKIRDKYFKKEIEALLQPTEEKHDYEKKKGM